MELKRGYDKSIWAKEDKAGWSGFLKHLKERGLRGIGLIISDACMGLSGERRGVLP
jgi:transposase-like protein